MNVITAERFIMIASHHVAAGLISATLDTIATMISTENMIVIVYVIVTNAFIIVTDSALTTISDTKTIAIV
ncbi:hypothetical protein [Halalkalibacter krulwichiae]|uniref:hypothetical protein n=1 Tax=Halalkalibacter krulwichiae TaxID=199441 RepID=UPI000824769F|nr:hypothetical protein [Halalkalibacter krulwichiae]